MNPFQHGGGCTSPTTVLRRIWDLGHYERFLDITTTRKNNSTTGQIYHEVITKERRATISKRPLISRYIG